MNPLKLPLGVLAFMFIATSHAQSPGNVSTNLTHWFKADAGITTDANGVSTWADQATSDGSDNATRNAGVTSDYPDLQTAVHNYNPAVNFPNGDNGYFDITNDLSDIKDSNYDIYAVVERNTSSPSVFFIGTTSTTVNESLRVGYQNNTTARVGHQGTNADVTITGYNASTVEPTFFRATLENTVEHTISYLTQGSELTGTDTTDTDFLSGSAAAVLGQGNRTASGFVGVVSEVVIYNAALTATEQLKIQSYLAIKYGLTLDDTGGGTAGDYLDSAANTIWDASANSTYHNDVAGIGRDDDSVLNQKQSISASGDAILTISIDSSVAVTNVANSGSFDDDGDFLIWGNNGSTSSISLMISTVVNCLRQFDRSWKVQNIGSVGNVTLQFDMTGFTASDFSLIIDEDGDGDYTTGNLTLNSLGSVNGDDLTFTGVTLSDGDVFTLVTKTPATPDITYSGGSWSGGAGSGGEFDDSATDLAKSVQISESVTLTGSHNCKCLIITGSAEVTVQDNNVLTVSDYINSNGSIFLYGKAELIQTRDGSNINTSTGQLYKIIGEAGSSVYTYNYLSSPVNTSGTYSIAGNLKFNNNALDIEDNTDPTFTTNKEGTGKTLSSRWFYTFPNGAVWNRINQSTAINPGLGFTVKGTGTINHYNFIGSVNNGQITATIGVDNHLLLGNPYPSSINIDGLNTALVTSNITSGTIYLWNHPSGNSHIASDFNGGYATRAGGTGAPPSGVTGGSTPGNTIKPGQGFLVTAGTSGGDIIFQNSMRIAGTAGHFFKAKEEEPPVIRIGFEFDIEEDQTYHRQLPVVLRSGHSLGKDIGYDAPMFDYKSNDMYWLLQGEGDTRYVIASVSNLIEDEKVPLGIALDEEREVRFKLDKLENYSSSVYLYDGFTDTYTNLTQGDYIINLPSGNYNNRFSVAFKEEATLSEENVLLRDLNISQNASFIKITTTSKDIEKVELLSINGHLLKEAELNSQGLLKFGKESLSIGVYILKVTTKKGAGSIKILIE